MARPSPVVPLSALSVVSCALALALGVADEAKPDRPAPRIDAQGDPLPDGALMRLGTSRFRYLRFIFSLAVSPDGKWIATGNGGSGDASVAVWEADTGKRVHIWTGQAHVVRGLAFSADSKRVAVANGYGKVVLFDRTTGKELKTFDITNSERVCFTADGSTFLASDGKVVRRWDLAADKELTPLRGHENAIFGLAVAADGKTTATCAMDGTARLWDADGRERKRFTVPEKYGLAIVLSRDGKTLACGTFEGGIVLWNTTTERQLWRVKTGDHRVGSLSFSLDGKTLASGGERLRLWDVASGKQSRVVEEAGFVEVVAFSPDGKRVVTGGRKATLRQWDAATGKEVGGYDGPHHPVFSASFSPDGATLATASDDPFVRLWDLASGKMRRFGDEPTGISFVAFAPEGKELATTAGGFRTSKMSLWDTSTGRQLRCFEAPSGEGVDGHLFFSQDGKIMAASTSAARVCLWDPTTGRQLPHVFEGKVNPFGTSAYHYVHFALSPDGKTVATTIGEHRFYTDVVLWDATTGKERRSLTTRGSPTAFSPDGRLLAIRDGAAVVLVDTVTGQERRRVKGDASTVNCAAFSPDGKTLATGGGDKVVHLWETATGERRDCLAGHQDPIRFVAFSPDGLRLASGGDDCTVLIWDLTGAKPKARLTAKERDALWTALAGDDGQAAYRAVRTLAAVPAEALPLLKERLEPSAPIEAKKVKPLLVDLDGDAFEVRERASKELEKMGHAVVPLLRKAMKDEGASAEVCRRLKDLLDTLDGARLSTPELRAVRAIEVLERVASKDARQLLDRLARGAEGAPRTEDARAAVRRLARRERR